MNPSEFAVRRVRFLYDEKVSIDQFADYPEILARSNDKDLEINPNYHKSLMLDSKHFYTQIFPFLEHFQLVASINRKVGIKELRLEYLGANGEILDGRGVRISSDDVKFHGIGYNDWYRKNKNGYCESELGWDVNRFRKGYNAENDDSSLRFIKWVEKIAKSGIHFMEYFTYFSDLQVDEDFWKALAMYFLELFALYDNSLIYRYLEHVQQTCFIRGKYNVPLLYKALYGFRRVMAIPHDIWMYIKQILLIDKLLKMNLPLHVYMEIFPYKVIKLYLSDYPNYERDLFRKEHPEPQKNFYFSRWIPKLENIARDPEAVKYIRFRLLFSSKNTRVLTALIWNKNSYKFAEFKRLFDSKSSEVLFYLAQSVEAAKFPEYRKLFKLRSKGIQMMIAKNPGAANFPEYR